MWQAGDEMKIPIIDLQGRVTFPQDKPTHQEEEHVGTNAPATDYNDIGAALEAEQTADLAENDRQRAEKLWNDGWACGWHAGYRDAVEDRREKSDGDD
jgi:hypothetical protein